jgi:diguanylate cyclase (GGDEF)-like protein
MQQAEKRHLSSIKLLKLYGKIGFSWDLPTDYVQWYGPLAKLLNLDLPLLTGTNYLNRVSSDQFWVRLNEMVKNADDHYTVRYMLLLANNEECLVEEEGEIIRNEQGLPIMIKGTIQAVDGSTSKFRKDLTGYDALTGFPKTEVLLESLTSIIDTTKRTPTSGGYLCISIDCMSWIYWLYDVETLQNVIKTVGKQLRSHIRFNDVVGRISGCCFGAVLRDTDEWGIFNSAERLQKACQEIEIKTPNGTFYPTVSIGGAIFNSAFSPLEIMQQAERNLFEMQNIKGTGTYVQKPHRSLPIPVNQSLLQKGKQRFSDLDTVNKTHIKKSENNLQKSHG